MQNKITQKNLYDLLRIEFNSIPEYRSGNLTISLSDGLMSAFSIFSLKEKSLLQFHNKRECNSENLKNIYGIKNVPSDTHMRKMLDPISPDSLRGVFTKVFKLLQRTKRLESYKFLGDYYLLSADGTGYFSSEKVHCKNCMEKVSRNGKTTYYHQFNGASIVHPDLKTVIPLCPEPIQKQDGSTKNDCERNASKQILSKFRKEHPKLKVIITEDGLASNAPHIKDIISHNMSYILGVKPGDHKYLFSEFEKDKKEGKTNQVIIEDEHIVRILTFKNKLPLNSSNKDLLVNFIELKEIDNKKDTVKTFTKITDIEITERNALEIMRGGRARWKIEKETFNTLKNQGYNFEHNFGHGKQNLTVNFAMLMLMAFLVDQVIEMCDKNWNKAREKLKAKRAVWEKVLNIFQEFEVDSMEDIIKAIISDGCKKPKLII